MMIDRGQVLRSCRRHMDLLPETVQVPSAFVGTCKEREREVIRVHMHTCRVPMLL